MSKPITTAELDWLHKKYHRMNGIVVPAETRIISDLLNEIKRLKKINATLRKGE